MPTSASQRENRILRISSWKFRCLRNHHLPCTSQIRQKIEFLCNPRVRFGEKLSAHAIRATDGSRISWISYALCDISLPCRPQDGLNGLPYLSIFGLIVNLRSFPGVAHVSCVKAKRGAESKEGKVPHPHLQNGVHVKRDEHAVE